MTIDKNTDMLLFRFSNFGHNSFIPALQEIIRSNGHVWMLKVGKRSSVIKLNDIKDCGGWLVLRSPKADGSKSFIAKFTDFSEDEPKDSIYPQYYNEIIETTAEDDYYNSNAVNQWFKLEAIDELSENDADNFVITKTGKKVNEVIGTTRTAVMFIKNSKSIIL